MGLKTVSPTFFIETRSGEQINLTPGLPIVSICPKCGGEFEIWLSDFMETIRNKDIFSTMIFCYDCTREMRAAELERQRKQDECKC